MSGKRQSDDINNRVDAVISKQLLSGGQLANAKDESFLRRTKMRRSDGSLSRLTAEQTEILRQLIRSRGHEGHIL